MDLEGGSLNIEKVRNTFLHHEVERILGIPISLGMIEDPQSWPWTKNGVFSIKSAYGVSLKILKESKEDGDVSEGLDRTKMMKLWKLIWNLDCPSKIKHFM